MLKHLKHTQIDQKKWDKCLLGSADAVVYCQSWFLNIIHPGWEALVIEKQESYTFIMPLLHDKKYGLSIHPKPVLAQRLGMFGLVNSELTKEIKKQIEKLFASFIYPLSQHYSNDFCQEEKINHILPLSADYTNLQLQYRRDRKTRLKQAKNAHIEIVEAHNANEMISLLKEEVSPKISGGVSSSSFSKIHDIITESLNNKSGFLVKAIHDNQLISIAFFITYKNRITYLFSANTKLGRSLQANTLILDTIIKQYAGSHYILDFEGSHISGIADFFKGFGAEEEKYFHIKYESPSIKVLKKIKSIIRR
ncbi:hypothetical protein [Fulvivirga sediminis]|uniref:BioF2-like acetyltransferase domain-containing protein n=1 Tax=Fulvivirga sediminis TaxID=2803949 RepID=A0A937K0M0_9BACT|nr:hypothetical protein [Fulvivirga sediminis]MBL3656486.1 hypothetical protein [Fulvivirga sediminis]